MTSVSNIALIINGLWTTALLVGTFIASKTVVGKQNSAAATQLIANLQKLRETDKEEFNNRIDALEKRHREDERLHNENAKAIADLQGQLKTYKELPLVTLADGISQVAKSNDNILKILEKNAMIAAEDRDVLTNQNAHIRTEVTKIMDKTVKPSRKKKDKNG